jgi:uncharacterized membrane protein
MTVRTHRPRLVAPALGGGLLLASALLACGAPTAQAPTAQPPTAKVPRVEAARAPRCEGPPPTYAADVRPVLERRCLSCHAGDGPAAEDHDFSREDVLWAQRTRVADEVSARSMPPASRPQLTDAEADVLLRWATCAPRG